MQTLSKKIWNLEKIKNKKRSPLLYYCTTLSMWFNIFVGKWLTGDIRLNVNLVLTLIVCLNFYFSLNCFKITYSGFFTKTRVGNLRPLIVITLMVRYQLVGWYHRMVFMIKMFWTNEIRLSGAAPTEYALHSKLN